MNSLNFVSESELFQTLSKKLGTKETKLLIKYVNENAYEAEKNIASKEDLANAKIEIIEKVQKSQYSLLSWIIVLWLSTLGVVLTLALTLFK
jgi:hypothetical protein